MMIFFEDTEIVRSILARIASYFASLLDARNSNRISYSILSSVKALSCKLTSAPVCREVSSTLRIHQSALPGSTSYWGISTKKSANICPFISKLGLYWISSCLSSIAHRAILHDKSGLCMVLRYRVCLEVRAESFSFHTKSHYRLL